MAPCDGTSPAVGRLARRIVIRRSACSPDCSHLAFFAGVALWRDQSRSGVQGRAAVRRLSMRREDEADNSSVVCIAVIACCEMATFFFFESLSFPVRTEAAILNFPVRSFFSSLIFVVCL